MNGNSNCCGATTNPCDSTIAELPRYYPRQLITPDDLTLEQNYFRDRMRRHNRLLHGWGVVCGALVCPATTTNSDGSVSFTAWQVQVQTGYLLGPYGDEIILDCVRTVDLRTSGVTGVTGEPCVDAPDPWCSQVFTTPSTTSTLFIAIKYKQSMMRPVRVQPVGCGCDDTSCEYSRLHDGYEIGVLTTCPTCNACDKNVLPAPQPQSLITGAIPSCPDCSCGPWVCLAQVTLSADGSGTIQQIDNVSCRRLVVSLCDFWWQATGSLIVSGITDPGGDQLPIQLTPDGKTQVTLTVSGTNLQIGPGVTYSFGPGILVAVSGQTAALQTGLTSVTLTVTAQTSAAPGIYSLTVVNADCSSFVFSNAVQVVASGSAAATPAGSAASGAVAQPQNKAAGNVAPAKSVKTKGGGTKTPQG
jgi:hypothetical protein